MAEPLNITQAQELAFAQQRTYGVQPSSQSPANPAVIPAQPDQQAAAARAAAIQNVYDRYAQSWAHGDIGWSARKFQTELESVTGQVQPTLSDTSPLVAPSGGYNYSNVSTASLSPVELKAAVASGQLSPSQLGDVGLTATGQSQSQNISNTVAFANQLSRQQPSPSQTMAAANAVQLSNPVMLSSPLPSFEYTSPFYPTYVAGTNISYSDWLAQNRTPFKYPNNTRKVQMSQAGENTEFGNTVFGLTKQQNSIYIPSPTNPITGGLPARFFVPPSYRQAILPNGTLGEKEYDFTNQPSNAAIQVPSEASGGRFLASAPSSPSEAVSINPNVLAAQLATSEQTGLPLATIQANWMKGENFSAKYNAASEVAAKFNRPTVSSAPISIPNQIQGGTLDFSLSSDTNRFPTSPIAVPLSQDDILKSVSDTIKSQSDKGFVLTSAQSDVKTGGTILTFRPETATEKLGQLGVYYLDSSKLIGIPYNTKGGSETASNILSGSIQEKFDIMKTAAYESAQKFDTAHPLLTQGTPLAPFLNQEFRVGVESAVGQIGVDFLKSAIQIEPAAASVALSTKNLILQQRGLLPPVSPQGTSIEERIMFVEKPAYVLGTFSAPLTYEVAPKLLFGAAGAIGRTAGEILKVENSYILQRGAQIAFGGVVAVGGATAGIYKTSAGGYAFSPSGALGGVVGVGGLVYGLSEVYPKVGSEVFQNAPILKSVNNPFIREEIVSPAKFDQYTQADMLAGKGTAAEQKAAGSDAIIARVAALKTERGQVMGQQMAAEQRISAMGANYQPFNPYSEPLVQPFKAYAEFRTGYTGATNRLSAIDEQISSMSKPMVDKGAMEAARSQRIQDIFKPQPAAPSEGVLRLPIVGRTLFVPTKTVAIVGNVPAGVPFLGMRTGAQVSTASAVISIPRTTFAAPSVSSSQNTTQVSNVQQFLINKTSAPQLTGLEQIQQSINTNALRQGNAQSQTFSLSQSQTQSQIQSQVQTQSQSQLKAQSQLQIQVQPQVQSQSQTQAQTQVQTQTLSRLLTQTKTGILTIPLLPYPQEGAVNKSRKRRFAPTKFQYTPSVIANFQNIRRRLPSGVTSSRIAGEGLEIRPIPISRTGKAINTPILTNKPAITKLNRIETKKEGSATGQQIGAAFSKFVQRKAPSSKTPPSAKSFFGARRPTTNILEGKRTREAIKAQKKGFSPLGGLTANPSPKLRAARSRVTNLGKAPRMSLGGFKRKGGI